jgi:hypothetical protein
MYSEKQHISISHRPINRWEWGIYLPLVLQYSSWSPVIQYYYKFILRKDNLINRLKIFSIIDCREKVCQLLISITWSIKPWSAIHLICNTLSCLFSISLQHTIVTWSSHHLLSVTLHILHSLFSHFYHRGCPFLIWTCSNIEWPDFMMSTVVPEADIYLIPSD